MFRYFTVFVLLGYAATTVQAQCTISTCYTEQQYDCDFMGGGYQGQCLLNDCGVTFLPGGVERWTCEKPTGLLVHDNSAQWWDIKTATLGQQGSTAWYNPTPPLDGCGFIIFCDCDPMNHWKCVDGATDQEFIPEQFRIGAINCVGT
jgi:hypothetical protein